MGLESTPDRGAAVIVRKWNLSVSFVCGPNAEASRLTLRPVRPSCVYFMTT